MSQHRDDGEVFWLNPVERGIFLPSSFHVPGRLRRLIYKQDYEVRVNTSFLQVMLSCASPDAGREETWISPLIIDIYTDLHHKGHGHSFEIWQEGELIAGLYGISIGAAFFGESMFGTKTNASKIALVETSTRLFLGGYKIFDTQFWTSHLNQFGCLKIPQKHYLALLSPNLNRKALICHPVSSKTLYSFVQSTNQTS